MEREKLESLIIDYIDNKLNLVDRRVVEEELVRNAEAYKLYEELKEVIDVIDRSVQLAPPPTLNARFEDALRNEVDKATEGRRVFFPTAYYRVAAAVALIAVSGAIGFWISRGYYPNERLTEVERQMEITRKQLAETKQAMMELLGNDQSASQRIRGVNVAMDISRADADIVAALFKTMNTDPNTNVRLAALEALGRFQHDPSVREGLVAALSQQRDPIVQIALIQLLVQMKEKGVVDDLRKIVDDARTLKAVRDEAYSGIMKLS